MNQKRPINKNEMIKNEKVSFELEEAMERSEWDSEFNGTREYERSELESGSNGTSEHERSELKSESHETLRRERLGFESK